MPANSILRFPLPLLGLNTVNPYIEHDSGYARELTNCSIYNGRVFMRPAVQSYIFNAGLVNAVTAPILWFDPTSYEAIISTGESYNTSTGALINAAGTFLRTATATRLTFSGTATTLNMVFGIVRQVPPAAPPDDRRPISAVSPFAAIGPDASVTLGSPTCGTAHKGRLYYASGYRIEWGNVGQVAGAFPAANFVSLEQFLAGQSIFRLFSISLSPGAAPSQNLFVVFGQGGRVLVFEGDNPASATWNLIFSADMPAPGGRATFLEIDGDIFVVTNRYAYWFKDLFAGGAQAAYENSPTMPIENLWQTCQWQDVASPILSTYVCYFEPLDAILCTCAGSTENIVTGCFSYGSNPTFTLVYFRKYRAWALWGTTPFFYPVITGGGTLPARSIYGTGARAFLTGISSDLETTKLDALISGAPLALNTIAIETSWKTPYAFFDKGIGIVLSSVRGWFELLHSPTLATVYKSRAIFNYSDFNAPYGFYTQSMVTQINPGRYSECATTMQKLAYNQYQPLLQLGGDGSGLSLQISFQGQVPDPGYFDGFIYSTYGLSALVTPGSEIF